ncbi:MAG: lamin tail domain-containing protein [Myxococcota bacterium]
MALVAAIVAAGCSPRPENPLPPPPAAHIKSFTVSPGSVARPGDRVTITWETENATSISLEQVGAGPVAGATATSGSATVAVEASTVFVLTARGEGGTDARSAGVSLATQSSSVLFSALPSEVAAGQSASLVWYAPGAQAVSLTEVGGAAIDVRGQQESGVVTVTPTQDTSYELTVDGTAHTVAVSVKPVIVSFGLQGAAPAPAGSVTVAWETRGATHLTLTRDGATTPVLEETDLAKIASGTFTDTVPADVPVDGVVTYVLKIEAGTRTTTQAAVIRVGAIDLTLNVPNYAKVGQVVPMTWTSSGAESLTVAVDDQIVFVASTEAEVRNGSYSVVGKAAPQQLELVARNSRGAETRKTATITPVGDITFNTFTATPNTIATGGAPVTLAWNVTNARRVRLSQVGGGFTTQVTGNQDTGTVDVYPNRPTVTYQLEADNQAGDAIVPQRVTVTVTTPGVITVSRKLPAGAPTTITGTTVPGATTILGLPTATLDAPGEGFVDISTTGTEITSDYTDPDDGSVLVDVGTFATSLFGTRVGSSLAVGTNGWMYFSTTNNATTIPSVPVTTNLQPLSLAVFARDLELGTNGRVFWRLDTVGGVDRLIVQWDRVEVYNDPATSLTFQAQLYSTGKVVYAYGQLNFGTATYSVGVVNGDETAYLSPTTQPVSNQTVTFFRPVDVASLPVPHTVQKPPYYVMVQVGSINIEARLDDALVPGDLGISEINPRPAAGLTDAEWIELTNTTGAAIDLEGWSLAVGTLTYTFPMGVSVPANGRLLMAQAADLGDGATVTPGHLYPNTFLLPDTSGTLNLRPPGSTTAFARFDWNAATAPVAGRSVQADPPSATFKLASPFSTATCPAPTTATYGTTAQQGTPGAAQPRCFPYVLEPLPPNGFQSIAATGTTLVLASNLTTYTTYQVTLPQAVRYFGTPSTTLSVCSAGWLSTTPTTSTNSTNKSLPSSTAPVGAIAPFWDINTGNTSNPTNGLYWEQRDPDMTPGSGDELTIVSWEGFRYNSSSYTAESSSWQVVFHGNGDIDFHYGNQNGTSSFLKGSSATSWIENPAGNAAMFINVNSSTAPGISPNTGFRYRYTP